jgi:hypothetical protein
LLFAENVAEDAMTDYANLPDAEAEALIFTELRRFDIDERLRYVRIGLMCQTVQKRMLWQARTDPETGYPCRSFNRWMRAACPYAYGTAFQALKDVEALADVPAAELAQIPQANIPAVRQLSSRVRKDPEVLAAAKTQNSDEFVSYIQAHHPGQHISHRSSFRLNPTEEQKSEILEAIELAIERGDASTKEEAVMMWAIDYKSSSKMTDRNISMASPR